MLIAQSVATLFFSMHHRLVGGYFLMNWGRRGPSILVLIEVGLFN